MTTEENRIKDKPTIVFMLTRVEAHKKELEDKLGRVNHIIEKINTAK